MEGQETSFLLEQTSAILSGMNKDDHVCVLNHTDILLSMIPDSIIKELKLQKLKFEVQALLQDKDQMRVLHLLQKVKEELETSIEYYYKDRGRDDRLYYNVDVETKMIRINAEIRKAIGSLLKTIGGEVDLG